MRDFNSYGEDLDSGSGAKVIKIQKWCPTKKSELAENANQTNDILVIDDNYFNIFAINGLLTGKFNLSCDTAVDGDLALKLIMDKHQATGGTYKLILIDYQMPELSGPEATKSIIKFLDDR